MMTGDGDWQGDEWEVMGNAELEIMACLEECCATLVDMLLENGIKVLMELVLTLMYCKH